jgi:signal transduction histidine kinase
MRRRLFVYLILAVVPLTLLAFYISLNEGNEEDAQARAEEKALVRVVRTDIERVFQLSASLVSGLAAHESDRKTCESFPAWRQAFPEFFNIGIFESRAVQESQTGQASAVYLCGERSPRGVSFPVSAEEAELLKGLRTPGQTVVGAIRPGVLDGRPVIPVVGLAELRSDGRRRFVAASIGLSWLNAEVNRIAIPSEAVLLVTDRHGTIAAHNPPSGEFGPGRPAPDFERTLPVHREFDGELIGEAGISRFYVMSRVNSADGLTVILKMRSSAVFRRSRERLTMHLAGVFAVSGLVFCLAWINSNRYLIRPLARLGSVAGQLARGDLSARTDLKYQDEIGRLARSFDAMAEALQREKTDSAQMLESLRALTARLDSVAEEERCHIAREIHDELGQQLTAMRFELARIDRPGHPDSGTIQDLIALVESSVREVRKIGAELRPMALDNGGLTGSIEWLAEGFRRRTGIRCRVRIEDGIHPAGPVAGCLFRICQESLTNVGRHARATAVEIALSFDAGLLILTVRDNGRGFREGATDPGSLGLLGMRERARIAGGTFGLESAPGRGSVVEVRVPAGEEMCVVPGRAAKLVDTDASDAPAQNPARSHR